jgi:hypothetical protein
MGGIFTSRGEASDKYNTKKKKKKERVKKTVL